MSQQDEINKFLKSFEHNLEISLKAVEKTINGSIFELYKRLIDNTVVGNPLLWKTPAPHNYVPGNLRKSWRVSFTQQPRDAQTGRFISAQTITKEHGMVLKLSGSTGTKASIYNNAPYLDRIEYGSWSTQAPQGFVRLTLMDFTSIVDQQAAKYRIK